MVATLSTQRFFFSRDEGHWHAYRDDSRDALCGTIQLNYSADSIADALPSGAELHGGCKRALDGGSGAEPAAAVAEVPKKPKGRANHPKKG